jgi:hypothetical protein
VKHVNHDKQAFLVKRWQRVWEMNGKLRKEKQVQIHRMLVVFLPKVYGYFMARTVAGW